MNGAGRPRLLLALAASVVFAFTGIVGVPLRAPDEIRVAEIGREMHASGDWIVPQLGGEPFLEQPPLCYAAIAVSVRAFGVSEGAARLPSALATLITLLLVCDMTRRLVAAGATGAAASSATAVADITGARREAAAMAGLLAVCVLASTNGFYRYSHRAMVDILLTLGVALGYWAWLRLLLRQRATPGLVVVIYVGALVAFLSKGPVGLLLLGGPIVIDLLLHRRWWLLRSWAHLAGVILLLGTAAGWPLLLWRRGGRPLLDAYLIDNVLHRAVPADEYAGGHRQPPWYYLLDGPPFLLPWVLAVPWLVAWLRSSRGGPAADPAQPGGEAARSALRAVALVLPVGLLLASIPGTKRSLYLLPLVPPFAVAVAAWLASTVTRGRKAGLRVAGALFVAALGGHLCAPWFADPDQDMRPLAIELRDRGLLEASLAGWQLDERTRAVVPWYTGHILANIDDPAALQAFVDSRPSGRLLLDDKRFELLPPAVAARLRPELHWDFGNNAYGTFTFGEPAVPAGVSPAEAEARVDVPPAEAPR